jgi:phage terminase large subunit
VHKLLANQIRSLGLQRWYDIDVRQIRAFNGSTLEFEGLFQNVDKIKSFEGADICWIEEAESISANSWEVLEPTLRRAGSQFLVNYNPDAPGAPTHSMFATAPRPDALVEHVTYADNPWLTEPLRRAMEYMRSVDFDAYRHVWEGETRAFSDAQILKGKFAVEEFEPGEDWAGPYLGLDFGYSSDPTAAVQCYVLDRTLFIRREAWGLRVDIDATPRMLLDSLGEDARRHTVRCDCSRPESISYLSRHGIPSACAAPKWSGSVEDGVAHLRSYERIVIHPSCEHTLEEARLYSFKVDRLTGAVLPDIVDKHNHCMDAIRYALAPLIKQGGADALLQFYRHEAARTAQPEARPANATPAVQLFERDDSDPHHIIERSFLCGARPRKLQ